LAKLGEVRWGAKFAKGLFKEKWDSPQQIHASDEQIGEKLCEWSYVRKNVKDERKWVNIREEDWQRDQEYRKNATK